jgi:hypothetical protein
VPPFSRHQAEPRARAIGGMGGVLRIAVRALAPVSVASLIDGAIGREVWTIAAPELRRRVRTKTYQWERPEGAITDACT